MIEKQPANRLYQQIKDDIRKNQLPIGSPLKQVALSERYDVSRIPIRDVLARLRSEGWLTECGKRGVMIPPLSATQAEDLYLMRMYLEPLILNHAVPKISNQVLGKAEDLLEQMALETSNDIMLQGELNWQFHACLYHAAERPTLFNTIASLHQQCARYIGYHSLELAYLETSQGEHYQLLDAVKNKHTSKAKNILKAHISEAGEILVTHLLRSLQF